MMEWKLRSKEKVLQESMVHSLKDLLTENLPEKETKIIIIEGSCGAGKTTFAKRCKEYLERQGKTVWGMNESFITRDPEKRIIKYGDNLEKFRNNEISTEQMREIALVHEKWIRNIWMEQFHEFMHKEQKPDYLIVDRSLFSTMFFIITMIKEEFYIERDMKETCKNYEYWEFWRREPLVIWWNTPHGEIIKRLTRRGRPGEKDLDYFQKLNETYSEYMVKVYPNLKVVSKETLIEEERISEFIPAILNEKEASNRNY